MVNITFKDVGQGDSIILEWGIGHGSNNFGIIDCHKKGNINPILEFLIQRKIKLIDFVVLSHPHKDHYSGFEEVLKYCLANDITIKRFAHPLNLIGTEYWKWFENDSEDLILLNRIIRLANELYQKKLLLNFDYLIDNWQIKLDAEIILKCLSPSHDEIHRYQTIVDLEPGKNKKEASSAANYLSSVFELQFKDHFILFTSDAEVLTFERFNSKNADLFKANEYYLVQLPHHGSHKNYNEQFWQVIGKKSNIHAIASAGQHHHYHHPSYEVLERLHKDGFTIHSTSILNGMDEFIKNILMKSLILDGTSTLAQEYIQNGDRHFSIT